MFYIWMILTKHYNVKLPLKLPEMLFMNLNFLLFLKQKCKTCPDIFNQKFLMEFLLFKFV